MSGRCLVVPSSGARVCGKVARLKAYVVDEVSGVRVLVPVCVGHCKRLYREPYL